MASVLTHIVASRARRHSGVDLVFDAKPARNAFPDPSLKPSTTRKYQAPFRASTSMTPPITIQYASVSIMPPMQ